MEQPKLKLSVLDQSPVRKGVSVSTAIQETVQLAKFTDKLGYTRFWVSEHHNTTTLAGSSPEILIGHLAGQTTTIRIGSGGIMLPNHSALKVAENFRLLETLFPGRIDLGIGRAPGTDRVTAAELNPSNKWSEQEFIEKLVDLKNYLHDEAEPGSIQSKIVAIPKAESIPPMWLLSSSGQSGLFAAHFGMGLTFAHFINPVGGPQAVQLYRNRFQPSDDLTQATANAAFFIFCSESEEKIRQQQAVMDYRFLQLEKGLGLTAVSYQDIKNANYTAYDEERIVYNRQRMITGTPEILKQKLTTLAAEYAINELIAVTITEDFEDRLTSYSLLADIFL